MPRTGGPVCLSASRLAAAGVTRCATCGISNGATAGAAPAATLMPVAGGSERAALIPVDIGARGPAAALGARVADATCGCRACCRVDFGAATARCCPDPVAGVVGAGVVVGVAVGSTPVSCVTVWSRVVTTLSGAGTGGTGVSAKEVPALSRHSATAATETVVGRASRVAVMSAFLVRGRPPYSLQRRTGQKGDGRLGGRD